MSVLTPAQIFAFYHTRLTEVLTKHNPAALKTIGALLRQFPKKEHQVYIQICKKFGVEPVDKPTVDDFKDGVVKLLKQESMDARVVKWLNMNDFKKYVDKHHFQAIPWEEFSAISSKGKLIELGVIPKDATLLLNAIIKERGENGITDKLFEPPSFKADFDVGENCYTKVVMANVKGGEKWLNARVTNVNDDNSFDIFVYNSEAHSVPPEAVNVPRDMLKKLSEKVQVAVPALVRSSAKRPQFQPGERVRIFGLRSHKSYNGLCGSVILYVSSERRYQVGLDTGDVIAIKRRNVGPAEGDDRCAAMLPDKKKPKSRPLKSDDAILSGLMAKLMQDNPNMDAGKLGEFAAGYLVAKRKMKTLGDN